MSRVVTFAMAVAASIKADVPSVTEATWQLGRFNLDDLARVTGRGAFVVVGILSAHIDRGADSSPSALTRVAAFVVTKGKKAEREHQAWSIGEAIAVLADSKAQFWGLQGLGVPMKVRLEPLTSVLSDDKGVSLLAVQWEQKLHRIGEGVFDADPEAPAQLFIFDEEQDGGDDAPGP
ncbi:hypothetical protein [Kaistia sp. MMO-174]|uniref:hypothetical protein n=1 Tax=Kaistia sp. MMO-174 TaxID=3081256 RepID=UPI0030180282